MPAIPWTEREAAHLLRRAAWGGTAEEIGQAVRDGLEPTVRRLIDASSLPNDDLERRLEEANLDLTSNGGIIRWWILRMLYSVHPLEERMTLFLHDHFATSLSKVPPEAMLAQNVLLRRFALGNFTELTIEISRDPAMLLWLDNFTSRREHPNENYARELLELFTLGHGNYSETDVLSSARAFTGWTLSRLTRGFVFRPEWHDDGDKEFLGRIGPWNGDDVVRIACGELAHGQLIARKLFSWFAYEDPDTDLVNRFATIYLDSGTELKVLVEAILTSPEMYSEPAFWSRVKSPVEYAVTAAHQLGLEGELSRVLLEPLFAQGQVPFAPPDVDGWPSGLSWINSATLLSRINLSYLLSRGVDPAAFLESSTVSAESIVDEALRRLGPLEVSAPVRDELIRYVEAPGSLPNSVGSTERQRGLIHLVLSLPGWEMN